MANLTWSIEKIIDCKGNDITSGGWVTITPTNGVGDTHASITVEPSTRYNDCETATITIATGTGEKKYVTVNRCNPQCDCNAIEFNPLEAETIGTIGEDGGTVKIANYSMKYGCTDAYMGIVNTKSGCDYNITNGEVYAIIGKNPSTTSDREFEYYVTYNGERCYGDGTGGGGTYKGNFEQEKSTDPCEAEDCNSVSIDPEEKWVDYTGETVTVTINASDCWEVRETHDTFGGMIESVTFNKDMTESYIKISRNNTTSEDEREGHVKYTFINTVDGRICDDSSNGLITISQYPNPNPPTSCGDCSIINAESLVVHELDASPSYGTKTLAEFDLNIDCPDVSFNFVADRGNPSDIIIPANANRIVASQNGNTVEIKANCGLSNGIINENTAAYERTQNIYCSIGTDPTYCLTIPISQYGKSAPPTSCELVVDKIIAECIDKEQYISFVVRKNSAACPRQILEYSIDNTSITGTIYVDYNYSSEISIKLPEDKELEPGDYTVNWHNRYNDANAGSGTVNMPSCSEEITIRFEINVKEGSSVVSEAKDYLYHIDSLACFLVDKGNDNNKIFFPINPYGWSGLTDDSSDLGSDQQNRYFEIPEKMIVLRNCRQYIPNFGNDYPMLHVINLPYGGDYLTYDDKKFAHIVKLVQDVTINPDDFHITDGHMSGYRFYLAEIRHFAECRNDSYYPLIQRFNPRVETNWQKISTMSWDEDETVWHTDSLFISDNEHFYKHYTSDFAYDLVPQSTGDYYKNKINYYISNSVFNDDKIDTDNLLENKKIIINLKGKST